MASHLSSMDDWREWRRLRGWELGKEGWSVHLIAQALGVSPAAVSKWLKRGRALGKDALRSHIHHGAQARLTPAQIHILVDRLWHGPESYGFYGDVWTCDRIAEVIQREFGVTYHRSQVSRILKKMGWTPQVPITRAIQRDEVEIARWQQTVWPELFQRARHEARTVVFEDESGIYLTPGVVRTYAPRGVSPVLHEWQTRDHLSVMGGVTPEGSVYTLVRETSLNGLHSIAFLKHLLQCIGKRLLVIWDGSSIHRRLEVIDFIKRVGRKVLWVEPLPVYAPDLNPAEWLWHQLKQVELRNVTCLVLQELHEHFHLAVARIRRRPTLVQSFFAGAGLHI